MAIKYRYKLNQEEATLTEISDNQGEVNLERLVSSMKPVLNETDFVFCTFPGSQYSDHRSLNPIASFQEQEGLTLVLTRAVADEQSIAYSGSYRSITLMVHSSLSAVGLTAVVSSALADNGISANIVAAFYHDHIFVPSERAKDALSVLLKLSNS